MPCSYVQGFARNVLINAVCKIHRFLQFPTADRDPAGNFEKLTICRTARKGKKNYRPYCKVQLKMPYILPDYMGKNLFGQRCPDNGGSTVQHLTPRCMHVRPGYGGDETQQVHDEQQIIYVAVTGRKQTLFHCNLISYISRKITPDFLCPFMNYNVMYSKFQSHSYRQSLVIATLMFVFYQ